jgi:hypothetical protein
MTPTELVPQVDSKPFLSKITKDRVLDSLMTIFKSADPPLPIYPKRGFFVVSLINCLAGPAMKGPSLATGTGKNGPRPNSFQKQDIRETEYVSSTR